MSSPPRMLLVEDNVLDVELLPHTLKSAGFHDLSYEHVDSAEALLDALRRHEWDVVTTDNDVPGLNARIVLDTVQEARPGLPLIVVSGDMDLPLAISLLKAGAQDYVPKRELSRLPLAIQSSLREAASRRENRKNLPLLKASEGPLPALVRDRAGRHSHHGSAD